MGLEAYTRQDGLVSYSYKFLHHGRCYRGPLGVVSKAVAQRMELQAKARVYGGTHDVSQGIPTFNEFAPQFMEHMRVTRRERSSETYGSRLAMHILPFLGPRRLSDATTRCMNTYQRKRREEGASAGTVNGEVAIISSLLHYAVDVGILPDDARGKIHWPKREEKSIRILTIDEEGALLSAATPRLRPLIRFALQTGLFRNELLSLKWSDIHWGKRVVVISGELAKNAKRREIPLNREAIAVLRELQGYELIRDRVFGYRSLRATFYAATSKAGLVGVSCETLRHTFAHRCLEAGIKIHLVQGWLGHGSLKQTERYVGVGNHHEQQAIERLGNRVKPRINSHQELGQMSLALGT